MENDSRLGRAWRSITDKVQDQVWFQQGKVKWDELDSKSRTAIKYGSLAIFTFGVIFLVISSALSVSQKKKDLNDKLTLIQKIQSAQDEMKKLKEVTSMSSGGNNAGPWNLYFENQATSAGIAPNTLVVSNEKPVSGQKAQESRHSEAIIEVVAKKINVRQLVGFVFNVENGGRTAKVRKLQVDTQPDESGYLDVTLLVSAFSLKASEGG